MSTDRRQWAAGLVVALFPALVLTTQIGTGAVSFLILGASLWYWREARAVLRRDWAAIGPVVLAFGAYFLFVLLCYLLRSGAHPGVLEKPLRMLAALSALLMVRIAKPAPANLWRGVVCGALAGAVVVTIQRVEFGLERPGGLINAITFGDLSLTLGLLALASAATVARAREALWPFVGAVGALAGTIATGTRGALLALLFGAAVFLRYRQLIRARLVKPLAGACLGLLLVSYAIPQTGMLERVREAVANVDDYFAGGSAYTNVGVRLALWKGATLLIGEHPLVGQDLAAAKQRMATLVQAKQLDPVALPPSHFHNDILQQLVTGGVLGLLAWAGILLAPLWFFGRGLRAPGVSRERTALGLAGMLLATSYFSFGLTEVIFWSVRASMFYALMLFLLMGFYLNARDVE